MKKHIDTSLLPSIFDKLTDNEPRKKSELPITKIALDEYKNIVIRDIINLLNTTALEYSKNHNTEIFKTSTLGYGIPALSGVNIDDVHWEDLQKEVLRSIQTFEPRLIPESIKVNLFFSDEAKFKQGIMFEISGLLGIETQNNQIILETVMDTDSCVFRKLGT